MLDSNSVLFSNCLSLLLLTKKRVQVLGPAQTKNEKQQSSLQNKLFLGNVHGEAWTIQIFHVLTLDLIKLAKIEL